MRQKVFSIIALLLMTAVGAKAQTETLLTTITAVGSSNVIPATSANVSYSTEGVATLTFSQPTQYGQVAYNSSAGWGWWGYDWTATVTPADGYTITKCVFYDNANRTATDSEAPFVVETTAEDKTPRINDTPIDGGSYQSKGIKKIEVYGYAPAATLTDVDDVETALGSYAGQTVDVTYTRSFTIDKPSTVCLPFAYTPKSGETFYTFTGITEDGGNYTANMTEVVSPLVPNTPYLYMPSSTGDTDFSGTYAIPADIVAGTTTPDGSDWTFVGTYTTQEWTTAPTGTYGFSAQDANDGITQGQFVKVGAYVRIKPMRCYLKYKNGDEDYAGSRGFDSSSSIGDETLPETISVRLIGASGDVTSIGTLNTRTGEMTTDGWYTLDGKRLNGQPTRKGIYVNKGKKVIIK